jgi:hypothetical protein
MSNAFVGFSYTLRKCMVKNAKSMYKMFSLESFKFVQHLYGGVSK